LLRIDGLTFRIGRRVLLENTSVTVNSGHHVGLVGRNGAGKTTLLHLIRGALQPESGEISIPAAMRIGITSQESPSGPLSLIDFVLTSDPELVSLQREAENATDPNRIAEIHDRLHQMDAHRAEARAAKILAGLGFSEAMQQQPCDSLSGGWRMRVGLAALLFTAPDLLLLDEPTNHLDFEATVWLTDYLRAYPGTVLVVSHDRELLNRVADGIIHLENCALTYYAGNYDRFDTARRQRLNQIDAIRRKQDSQREKIIKFVERFRYKATKAKQAQSRLKMLEKMEPVAELPDEESRTFEFPEPKPLPPPLFSLDRVSAGYGDTPVLRNISLRLDADDRIALLGANGNGKSTFIKLLAGALTAESGIVSKSRKLKVGYFAQHQSDELDLSATPVIEMSRRRRHDPEEKIRAHLGRFGFAQERADTPVGSLSGGEKARLLFALMSAEAPNVLLLDEPTNHLDMESRDALVQAINDFAGAVVIVSHDPHVIELVADRLWLVADGTVAPFDGDLDDYRARVLRPGRDDTGADKKSESKSADRREQRRVEAKKRQALTPLRKRLKEAETLMTRLESEKTSLTKKLADPALYDGPAEDLIALQRAHGEAERSLAQAEETWLRLHEELEAAQ